MTPRFRGETRAEILQPGLLLLRGKSRRPGRGGGRNVTTAPLLRRDHPQVHVETASDSASGAFSYSRRRPRRSSAADASRWPVSRRQRQSWPETRGDSPRTVFELISSANLPPVSSVLPERRPAKRPFLPISLLTRSARATLQTSSVKRTGLLLEPRSEVRGSRPIRSGEESDLPSISRPCPR